MNCASADKHGWLENKKEKVQRTVKGKNLEP